MKIKSKSEQVVIVTPVYRNYVTQEEMASIEFGKKYLKSYEKVIVAPQKLSADTSFLEFWDAHQYKIIFFDNKYFDGLSAYNKLMLTVDFYKRFLEYEYILIYQLDALVLSNTLDAWLRKGYDYIGAPWIAERKKLNLESVGNGGLSLRRVKTFIAVLESKNFFLNHNSFISLSARAGVGNLLLLKLLMLMNPYLKKINTRSIFLFFYSSNEDLFWSFFAQYFIEDFTVSDREEALRFAFECHPQFCYTESKYNLPLGVHAWFRYDPSFWIEQFPELEQYVD